MFKQVLEKTYSNVNNPLFKDFCPWCIIHYLPGFGKTAETREWIKEKNLKSLWIDAPTLSVFEYEFDALPANDLQDFGAMIVDNQQLENLFTAKKKTVSVIFSSEFIDKIDHDTVIVVDNYDKASQKQRDELIKLIRYHKVIDPRVDGNSKIKSINPLMLVVIIDDAELITSAPLTIEELKLFALDDFIQYIPKIDNGKPLSKQEKDVAVAYLEVGMSEIDIDELVLELPEGSDGSAAHKILIDLGIVGYRSLLFNAEIDDIIPNTDGALKRVLLELK